jgi:BlaI family penicillinase repressor
MTKSAQSTRSNQLPTGSELDILNALWRLGPATVREVHQALHEKQTSYTTTLKQMQTMVVRNLLTRSERFRSHVYQAGQPKEETQRLLAGHLLERAFGGSARNLVLGALSVQKVSAAELADIRKLLDDVERESR